jgi:hypothetical protein
MRERATLARGTFSGLTRHRKRLRGHRHASDDRVWNVIRVVVPDDQQAIRAGVAALFETQPDIASFHRSRRA